jgi:hypothetical protein
VTVWMAVRSMPPRLSLLAQRPGVLTPLVLVALILSILSILWTQQTLPMAQLKAQMATHNVSCFHRKHPPLL